MFVLPAVHAVCDASSMAIHNRASIEHCRASRSFPYLIHPGPALPALAAGRRPAVLHRDLFGFLHLSASLHFRQYPVIVISFSSLSC